MMVSIQVNPSKFSPAEREIVLQTLEKCTDALAVYRSTLKQPMTRNTVDAFPEIGISKRSILQSLNGDAAVAMTDLRKQAVREKLRRNSLYVDGIIQDLKREISEHGTIEILIKEIKRIILQENEERVLLEKNKRMKMVAAELQKAISDRKMSSEKEEERLINKLNWTKDEKEELKLITNVEIKYIREWENVSNEQDLLRSELKINEMQKTFNDYYIRERNENRVNSELMHYLTQRITFIENRIEEWQRRYDIEKKMYEKEIRKARSEIEEVQADLKKLTTEYRSNQEFIDTYLAEQEALRRQKEHENHVCRSVIRMQAWWRGVMVRRKLGPYRPEEKKKKRVVKTKK